MEMESPPLPSSVSGLKSGQKVPVDNIGTLENSSWYLFSSSSACSSFSANAEADAKEDKDIKDQSIKTIKVVDMPKSIYGA